MPVVALYAKSDTTDTAFINLKCDAPDGAFTASHGLNSGTSTVALLRSAELDNVNGA